MFKLKENPTYLDFEHCDRTYRIELTEYKFVIEDVGEKIHSGHSTIYPSGERHVCGSSGYNPMLGDSCDACSERNRRSAILDAAHKHIQKVFAVEIAEDKLQKSIRKAKDRKLEQEKREAEERERKLKADAVKALPEFLGEKCMPQILSAMKSNEQNKEIHVTVGLDNGGVESYLAEAARCALVGEGLTAEVITHRPHNEDATVMLKISW